MSSISAWVQNILPYDGTLDHEYHNFRFIGLLALPTELRRQIIKFALPSIWPQSGPRPEEYLRLRNVCSTIREETEDCFKEVSCVNISSWTLLPKAQVKFPFVPQRDPFPVDQICLQLFRNITPDCLPRLTRQGFIDAPAFSLDTNIWLEQWQEKLDYLRDNFGHQVKMVCLDITPAAIQITNCQHGRIWPVVQYDKFAAFLKNQVSGIVGLIKHLHDVFRGQVRIVLTGTLSRECRTPLRMIVEWSELRNDIEVELNGLWDLYREDLFVAPRARLHLE